MWSFNMQHKLLLLFAAGVVIEEKNWPPFFPIIHHDIANEIPIHLQKLQYVAFTTLLGMSASTLIFYLFIEVQFPPDANTSKRIIHASPFIFIGSKGNLA